MHSVTYEPAAMSNLHTIMRRAGNLANSFLAEMCEKLVAGATTRRHQFTAVVGGRIGHVAALKVERGVDGVDFHIRDLQLPKRLTETAHMTEVARLEDAANALDGVLSGIGLIYPAREMIQVAQDVLGGDLEDCGGDWRAMASFMADLHRELPLVASEVISPVEAVIRARQRIIRKMNWLASTIKVA